MFLNISGIISNRDISASSSIRRSRPNQARPLPCNNRQFPSGWAPRWSDRRPYITVLLL